MDVTKQQFIAEMRKRGIKEKEAEQLWLIALRKQEEEQSMPSINMEDQSPMPINHDQRMSIFESDRPDNIVAFQLELDNILKRMEHVIRSDKLEQTSNDEWIWKKNDNPALIRLNEEGVQEIMNVLSAYVNRNTILGNYTKEEVNEIMYNLAVELTDLIFMKYEQIGFTDEKKRKNYFMLVTEIVDMVRNTYTRSIDGKERDSLRKMVSVNQTQPIGMDGMPMRQSANKSVFNPKRWFGGGDTSSS